MPLFTQWLIGVFQDRASADTAIRDLKNAGFDATQIGMAVWSRQDGAGTHEQGTDTADAVASSQQATSQGAATTGAGALVAPGAGSYLASGALTSTLTGAAAGHITDELMAMGLDQGAANGYQQQLEQGRAIVVLDTQGRDDQAQEVMRRDGASDLRAGQPETDRVGGGIGVSGATLPAGGGFRGSGAPINDTPDTTAFMSHPAPTPDAATPTDTPNNPQLPPEMQQWSDLGDPSLDPADTPVSTLSSTSASPLDVDSARQPIVGGGDIGQATPPPEHPRTDDQILADAGQLSTTGISGSPEALGA